MAGGVSLKWCEGEGVALTGLAVVDVDLALWAREARLAQALVAADVVLAGGAVATGVLHTLVDVDFTGLACKGRGELQCEHALNKPAKSTLAPSAVALVKLQFENKPFLAFWLECEAQQMEDASPCHPSGHAQEKLS